jgi:fucose 4-O-acetylase-like acetyltransferase
MRTVVYIDRLKGFGIFLVVLGHIIQMWLMEQVICYSILFTRFTCLFLFFNKWLYLYKTTKIDSLKRYLHILKIKDSSFSQCSQYIHS